MQSTTHTTDTGEVIDLRPITRVELDEVEFTGCLFDGGTAEVHSAIDRPWDLPWHKDGTISVRLSASDAEHLFADASYGAFKTSENHQLSAWSKASCRARTGLYDRLSRRLFDRKYYRYL